MESLGLEAPSLDQILEGIDAEMAASKQPKVILFDIGGVCVISPFQTILDYELSLGIPPGWINYSLSKTAPSGFWHRLERGELDLGKAFYDGFTSDLSDPARWDAFYSRESGKNPSLPREVPPVPKVDGDWLFNTMMSESNHPDPWMLPALKALKASGRYIIGALSNTVIFPPGHPLFRGDFFDDPVRRMFDVFLSSAHIGLRKPDPKIYAAAVEQLDGFARENASGGRARGLGWDAGVRPGEVLFLDDIGENLKAAKQHGFQTIKVPLGKAYEAVDELEKITGLKLAGDHPRIPVKPKYPEPKAKM